MRTYLATTNTDIVLALPSLAVTVRAAFYVPHEVLPDDDISAPTAAEDPKDEEKPDEERTDLGARAGRETWVGAKAVLAFFKLSGKVESGKPVTFKDVVDLDGKKIQASSRSRATGVVSEVRWSDAKSDEGNRLVPSKYVSKPKVVGEAQIPLWNVLESGSYVLAIVPPDKELTKPEEPAGPKTTIEPGVDLTYRPLYVLLSFDGDLNLTSAKTVLLQKNMVVQNPRIYGKNKKPVGYAINHGYVTGFSRGELAIDLKPDYVRTVRTNDAQKAAAESGKWARSVDMIVVHGTGGPLIGNALNTALGPLTGDGHPYGPHYELDRDGHNLKFAYDDATVSHAGPSNVYFPEAGGYSSNIGSRSVGIEVVNFEGRPSPGGGHAQERYRDHQILGLIRLLGELVKAHPKVERRRIVGHCDVKCVYDKGTKSYTKMDDSRLSCPGRQMDWPWLEEAGFGRLSVKKTLAATDYSGIFELVEADFPEKFPKKPGKDGIVLRRGDGDKAQKWGEITWTGKEAKELIKKKSLTLKGIILEMQTDLRTLGYFLPTNGEFDDKTELALKHYIWHTFTGSGDRRSEVPGGNGFSPKVLLTKTVAQYLKGTAEQILSEVAAAKAAKGAGGAAGAAGASAAAQSGGTPAQSGGTPEQHAELEPDLWGDVHDRIDRDPEESEASV